MKRLVLLVDDDRLPMRYYVRALEQKGFTVRHCLEPDSALEFVTRNASEIAAVVLDIMMPPGNKYKTQDTNEGLATGGFLLEDIRAHCPNAPVVVLTNVKNPETLAKFQQGPFLQVVQKMDHPPFELADLVTEVLARSQKNCEDKG